MENEKPDVDSGRTEPAGDAVGCSCVKLLPIAVPYLIWYILLQVQTFDHRQIFWRISVLLTAGMFGVLLGVCRGIWLGRRKKHTLLAMVMINTGTIAGYLITGYLMHCLIPGSLFGRDLFLNPTGIMIYTMLCFLPAEVLAIRILIK